MCFLIVLVATVVRLVWAVAVPTIPVGDFATYRESAIYLAEFGHFDHGFVYMPGLVLLLAAIHGLGGEVLAAKIMGAVFGGLAAGPVYLIAAHLVHGARRGDVHQDHDGADVGIDGGTSVSVDSRFWMVAPAASVAGIGYALWPAGIAMASVIGTDVPAAAMMLLALAFLCVLGDARPRVASAAFGVAMGLAAYFRAVALPLTVLSAGYWLARRAGVRAVLGRTALAVGMTVLLLLPWGLRNQRHSGEMYLTDSHGGITALMGNDPNTEGTYSRSVGAMFHELTGRTFLDEPHRQTDLIAYGLAKEWMTFDPLWTLGMIAKRCERLSAPERGLLYWSLYRPGVLPTRTAAWFNQYRKQVTGVTDLFYLLFVAGLAGGLAFACAEKRWAVLVPLPFAVALAGTYALFVAEPRYRLTSEILLFPIAAFGWVQLFGSAKRATGSLISSAAGTPVALASAQSGSPLFSPPSLPSFPFERRALIGTVGLLGTLALGAFVVVRGGAALRARHRWAATVWHIDGKPVPAFWRTYRSQSGPSSVRGAPPAAALILLPGQHEVAAEIILPSLAVSAGRIEVTASVAWEGSPADGTRLTLHSPSAPATAIATVVGTTTGPGEPMLRGAFDHPGGPLRLRASLSGPDDARVPSVALIGDVVLTTAEKR